MHASDFRWHVLCDEHGQKTEPELQMWTDEGGWHAVEYVEEKSYVEPTPQQQIAALTRHHDSACCICADCWATKMAQNNGGRD